MPETLPGEAVLTTQVVSEHDIANLYGRQDNGEYFDEILAIPGNDYISELTAVYFLRPTFDNGMAPPTALDPEDPLGAKIKAFDLDTIEDPTDRHVFQMLQFSMTAKERGHIELIDQKMAAAMLVPGILRKHSAQAAVSILEVMRNRVFHAKGNEQLRTDLCAESIAIGGDKIANTEPVDKHDAYHRLRLAGSLETIANDFGKRLRNGEHSHVDTSELKRLAGGVGMLRPLILERDLGQNQDTSRTVQVLAEQNMAIFNKDEDSIQDTIELASDPEVQRLVLGDGDNLALPGRELTVAYTSALAQDRDRTGRFRILLNTLASAEYLQVSAELAAICPDEKLDSKFLDYLGKDDSPSSRISTVINELSDQHLVALRTKLAGSAFSEKALSHLMHQFVRDPLITGETLGAVASDRRLGRITENPSPATVYFIEQFRHRNVELISRAGGSYISELYAQASKATDDVQIRYFTDRVTTFMGDLNQISGNPEAKARLEGFLEQSGELSSKQELRAVRVFKLMTILKGVEIQGNTLDELEADLIQGFIGKLTGQHEEVSKEQSARIYEKLGTIVPFLIYSNKFMSNEAYRQPLSEIISSIGNGTYETWRRGDGSPEAMSALVEAGHLPQNLTAAQYREWVNDRATDSFEQLVSSAEDTAAAICKAIALGSIDINLLAPGYALDISGLDSVVADRNNLGKLLGNLNKLKSTDGTLSAEQVQELAAAIGNDSQKLGIADVLNMLQSGATVEASKGTIGAMRDQLDQLRMLIRIANITAEEVAAGALLADRDNNGSRKVQDKLVDVLDELRSKLPEDLAFLPQSVLELLNDHASEQGESEHFIVEDTIDPKVTLEIGETPLRSCQHYETGGFNQGLIGYFAPEVKIFIVRNAKGGIIARSIVRLMEDEQGDAVMYAEPVYASVASTQVYDMLRDHAAKKAAEMGVEFRGSLGGYSNSDERKNLQVRSLRMPATYSDSAQGINTGSLSIRV